MPNRDRRAQDARRMARLLRGLDDRVSDLESRREQDTTPRPFRKVSDAAIAADAVTVTSDSDPTMTWDTDSWDFAEWGP